MQLASTVWVCGKGSILSSVRLKSFEALNLALFQALETMAMSWADLTAEEPIHANPI